MKDFKKYLLVVFTTFLMTTAYSQAINWASLKEENQHVLHSNLGAEYGLVYGIGYGYKIQTRFPVLATVEYSAPLGDKVLADFKTKIGAKIRWVQYNNFQVSTSLSGVFRRYDNDYVRLLNFGSDMSGVVGYYKSKWFVAGEFGFDKAIVTHFKQSDAYKENFPDAVDGWFEPSTGGNFYYGLQAGYSFGRNDIFVKAGKLVAQDFKTAPLLPFYGQIGINVRLN